MIVNIKLVDPSMPLPKYYTEGAVAFDIYSRANIEIPPRSMYRIPTNLIIEVPKGYMLYIKDRSSLFAKKNLLPTAGIIDQDFHGPNDEILFQVYNVSDNIVNIQKEERLGQGIFIKIDTAIWNQVDKIKDIDRGSFGSTD